MTQNGSKLRSLLVVLMLLAVPVLPGCRAAARTELTVTGSTTLLPIAEVAGEEFEARNAGTEVLVSGVGSSAGIESVAQGSSDIGTSSRELKPEEQTLGLVDTPVAYDAIAIIVHPDNKVRSLTMEQARAVFEGRIRNWKELGGDDIAIGLVNRDEASGTREAFTKIVLEGGKFDPEAAVLPGTGQVRSVVAGSRGAIGYISYGFVTPEVRALAVDGVEPSPESVTSGAYPVRRLLHVLTQGQPTGLAKEFIDFMLSEEIQEGVVTDAGFLPVEAEGR